MMDDFDKWKADYLLDLDSFWKEESLKIKRTLDDWMVARLKETADPFIRDYDDIGSKKRYEWGD